ncbi:MAG: hypothetical protein CVU72_07855, partial [Deltaproteobacteria bacterium HGW-Deltaproteobacteria-7]
MLSGRKTKRPESFSFMKPDIAQPLRSILARIGKPEAAPFVPDEFQVQALSAIRQNDCLVIAPTG